MKRVVVTGIGMINALGLDKDSSFKAICKGKTGVKKITSFDASDFPVQIAAEITDFDPLTVLDAKEVKKVDRFIQLGLKAAKEAMADANFGEFDVELANEFFQALAFNAAITLHITKIRGRNSHHILEASFKACAVALRRALAKNSRVGVPSTKGVL